jgi:hypothetical protein
LFLPSRSCLYKIGPAEVLLIRQAMMGNRRVAINIPRSEVMMSNSRLRVLNHHERALGRMAKPAFGSDQAYSCHLKRFQRCLVLSAQGLLQY